jgi:hypothetical protein
MTGLPPPNVLSYEGQVTVPFIDRPFPPKTSNYQFNVPTIWVDTQHQIPYILVAKPLNVANWIPFGGGGVVTESLTGNTGGPVPPTANNINIVGDGTFLTVAGNPGTSTLTLGHGGAFATLFTENTGTAIPVAGNLNMVGGTGISTSGSGNTVTITAVGGTPTTFTANSGSATPALNNLNIFGAGGVTTSASGSTINITASEFFPAYTNVTHAMSPYTVLSTDEYLSVDCSGGVVTLNFPNAPTANRTWIVKDRTGSSAASNITLTTPGGTVTFDGSTSYVMKINYYSVNILANATPTYEVF